MKLLAGEYKQQPLHSRYKATYYTFTPRTLTDEELWVQDVELSILTAKVYKELGVLEGIMNYSPNAEHISNWLKTKEVYYSLLIDDKTKDSFTEFYRSLHKDKDENLKLFYKAFDYSINNPFNLLSLSKVYKMLTNDTENHELTVFRQEPRIWCEIFTSGLIYNPTDPSEISDMYNDMVNFLRSNELTDSLAKSAVLHYQFEMIKPFDTYNGFLGRLIFSMVLNHTGFKAITHLAYSEFLYEHRENYFKILSSTQGVGDFLRLIKYFLRGMLSATERAISRVNNLEAAMLKDEMKIRNSITQVKGIYDVYAYFKQHLVSDIKSVSEDLGLSYNTASKAVDLLIKLKILNIETVQARHRKFRYTKVLKILGELQFKTIKSKYEKEN